MNKNSSCGKAGSRGSSIRKIFWFAEAALLAICLAFTGCSSSGGGSDAGGSDVLNHPPVALAFANSISGKVVSSSTNKAIAYAEVTISDADTNAYVVTTYTDDAGNYQANVPAAANYTVHAAAPGFTEVAPKAAKFSGSSTVSGCDILMTANLNLVKGWNLISFPRQPKDTAIGTALAPIAASIDLVSGFDNASKEWLTWRPGSTAAGLTTIESGNGYWIYMNSAASLDISDWGFPSSWPQLTAGKNLVGYAGRNGKSFAAAMSAFYGTWSSISTQENGQVYEKTADPSKQSGLALDKFQEGKAYWVTVDGADQAHWDQDPMTFWYFSDQGNDISGATVSIYKPNGALVYRELNATSPSGLFWASADSLPGTFVLEVTGGTVNGAPFTGYYRSLVSNFSSGKFYSANEVTTLIAAYAQKNPSVGYDAAEAAVKKYLSIPDSADMKDVIASVGYSDLYFSTRIFQNNQGTATYGGFINTLANEIGTGKTRDFSDPAALYALFDIDGSNESTSDVVAKSQAIGKRVAKFAIPKGLKDIFKLTSNLTGSVSDVVGIADTIIKLVTGGTDNSTILSDISTKVDHIDSQLTIMTGQLTQLENGLQLVIANTAWQPRQTLLGNSESRIAAVYSTFKQYASAAKDLRTQPTAEEAAVERTKKYEKLQTRFINDFTAPNQKDIYEVLMIDYQKDVLGTRIDTDPLTAIELYANYLAAQIPNSGGDAGNKIYNLLELRFAKMFMMQLNAARMIHEFKEIQEACVNKKDTDVCKKVNLYCTPPDGSGVRQVCEAEWTDIQDNIIAGFPAYKTADPVADPALGIQARAFERAVEKYVVSHTTEAWYQKWMQCDNMVSYKDLKDYGVKDTPKAPNFCTASEAPFLRSMLIVDNIIGNLKIFSTLGDNIGPKDRDFCQDSQYDQYTGLNSFFVKLIKMKENGVPDLTGHSLAFADRNPNGEPTFLGKQEPVTVREVSGKNPALGNGMNWSVATYRYPGNVDKVSFYPPALEWIGLHPLTERPYYQNEYVDRGYFPDYLRFYYIPLTTRVTDGNEYGFFSAWILATRFVYFNQTTDRGPFFSADRHPTFPIILDQCTWEKCRPASRQDNHNGDGALGVRLYSLGGNSRYAIGYGYDKRRHFLLPGWGDDVRLYGLFIYDGKRWNGYPDTGWTMVDGGFNNSANARQDYVIFRLQNWTMFGAGCAGSGCINGTNWHIFAMDHAEGTGTEQTFRLNFYGSVWQ